jgi:hypothetical protein
MASKPPSLLPAPLESAEAHTLMQYMQARGLMFTHIKNETGIKDERGEIKNFRALMDYQDGVSPGFPDFAVALPGIGLLFIELKRSDKKKSKVSPAQQLWIDQLNRCPGVAAHVGWGADDSIRIIEMYLNSKPKHSPAPCRPDTRN